MLENALDGLMTDAEKSILSASSRRMSRTRSLSTLMYRLRLWLVCEQDSFSAAGAGSCEDLASTRSHADTKDCAIFATIPALRE